MVQPSLEDMVKVIKTINFIGLMESVLMMIKRFILPIGGIIASSNGYMIPIMDKLLLVGMEKEIEEIN